MKAISNDTSNTFAPKNLYTRLDFDQFESFVNCNTKNYQFLDEILAYLIVYSF